MTSQLKSPAIPITAVLLMALFVLLGTVLRDSVSFDAEDPAYNKAYWEQEIRQHGAEKTYQEFLVKVGGESYSRTHFSAHAIGEVLYDMVGFDGIAICDDSFDFGCYHGFSSRAIAYGGENALTQLSTICIQSFDIVSACKHGLGHGVLEYTGPQHLAEALEMCNTLVPQDARLSGCINGVFMQYLTPSEEVLDTSWPERHIDPEHPYAPCTDVTSEFRSYCYFELGQWFRRTEGMDYGALCGALASEDARSCFLGVGADLTRGWKDPVTLREKCARYTSENELACRAGAAWTFIYNGGHTNLCSYLSEARTQECKTLADFTDGIDPIMKELLK